MNRILIAAADVPMAESVQASLSSTGFQTALVWDATQLLDFCNRHVPDVLAIDLDLPGGSVWAALQAIRTMPGMNNLPIIGLASDTGAELLLEHARSAGVTKLFAKANAAQVLPAELAALVNAGRASAAETSSTSTGDPNKPIAQLRKLTSEVVDLAEKLKPQIPAMGPEGPELFGYIEDSSEAIQQKLSSMSDECLHDKEIRHDFRNMIGSVTGFAELIMMEPSIPGDVQSALTRIRECSKVFVEVLDMQKEAAVAA
ncbi:MAG: response regulator transcription factor [Verrucomicrobiales bacterium]|nr:response regulator transcription factor [Verrucomicrobiales bacterium]